MNASILAELVGAANISATSDFVVYGAIFASFCLSIVAAIKTANVAGPMLQRRDEERLEQKYREMKQRQQERSQRCG